MLSSLEGPRPASPEAASTPDGILPTVDVVIPVHTAERPIRRAVTSVLDTSGSNVRALVVCHNVAIAEIARNLEGVDAERLRLIELHDGIPSPAGPLNAGAHASLADYVAFLGSDDEYEAGSLAFWSTELGDRPELLVGQFKVETAGRILAPAPRVGRFDRLDPVKDLLYFRTPPLTVLIRRELLMRDDCPGFAAGKRNGEDIALTLFLWSTASSIKYSRCSEGFWGWEGGADRVTGTPLPLSELFSPVCEALHQGWTERLSPRRRAAIAIKLARYQILPPLRRRIATGEASAEDIAAARRTLEELDRFAPGFRSRLSLGDHSTTADVLSGRSVPAGASAPNRLLALWRKAVPRNPLFLFSPESLVRLLVRFMLIPRTLRRAPSDPRL